MPTSKTLSCTEPLSTNRKITAVTNISRSIRKSHLLGAILCVTVAAVAAVAVPTFNAASASAMRPIQDAARPLTGPAPAVSGSQQATSQLTSVAVGTGDPGTLGEYWNGTADWQFVRKHTAATTGVNGFYDGTSINVMPDGTWYLFSRRVAYDSSCVGQALDTVIRKSTNKGATWSDPVVAVAHTPGTPWECMATDGSAFYNPAENKWHFLFQCLSGGVFKGCELSRAGSDPMGAFTISPSGGNPVIDQGELWTQICNTAADHCSILAGGPGRVSDEGTYNIFEFDGTYYWVAFHGFYNPLGFRGIAKTADFQTWIAGDSAQGVPSDAIHDVYDAQGWRETWGTGGNIGFGAGSMIQEGGYYYDLTEAADLNLGCVEGQRWDLGLLRSTSLTNTSWAQVPRGNPIVYSSRAIEQDGYFGAAGNVLRCNVSYAHVFRDPVDGIVYMMFGRRSNDPDFDGFYLYRLEKTDNALTNGDFSTASEAPWLRYGASTNAVVYRLPNLSPNGSEFLEFNCGGACNESNSVYQDVPITGGSSGTLTYGGRFSSATPDGSLTLALFQLDQSYNVVQTDSVTFTASTSWDARSKSTNLLPATTILRYQYYMNVNRNYRADDLYLQVKRGSDVTPPAGVADLAVKTGLTTATLTWTAPGDDGMMGAATSYDVRYSSSPITDANWSAATQATGEPSPRAAGVTERFKVRGLTSGTTYHFALKSVDTASNVSPLSAVQSATTGASISPTTNLALDAVASASTSYLDYSPSNANDGSPRTSEGRLHSWTNDGVTSMPQWLELDFGSVKTFNQVDLYGSEGFVMRDYSLQYWTGSGWTNLVGSVGGNVEVHRSHTFSPVSASRVRVLATSGPSHQPNFSRINEMEVRLSSNLAIGATTSASTTFAGYSAANINDGNLSTAALPSGSNAWTNDGVAALPQWVELNFGTSKTFNRVDLYTSDGYEVRDYQLQYWTGSAWLAIGAPVVGNTRNHRTHFFPSVSGSKVRVLASAGPSHQTSFVRINELQVHNSPNLASGATASASSTYSEYSPSKVKDGDTSVSVGPSNSWTNDGVAALPQWVELDFGSAKKFNRVDLFTSAGYELLEYQIQYWDGSNWKDALIGTTQNFKPERQHIFDEVTASKVRLLANSGPTSQRVFARVNELAVFLN